MALQQQKRLGDISRIYSGFAFRSQDLGDKGIPVLKIANIQKKLVSSKCEDHFPEELCTAKLDRYFLRPEDTLIAMTGAGSVGKVGKMPVIEGRFLVNQRVAIVRPDSAQCEPLFVYYALSQDICETKLYALGLGAGQPNVSAKQIGDLEVPFPPLPVQQRIASILSAYDELIYNNQRRITILESMARSLFREWFVHFRFPGFAHHPPVASLPGKIPQGWNVRTVRQIAGLVSRGASLTYVDTGGMPVVNQRCIRNDEIEMQAVQYAAPLSARKSHLYLRERDVLINSMGAGTLGRVSRNLSIDEPTIVHNCITVVRAKSGEPTAAFLFYCLSDCQEHFERLGVGATGQTSLRIETIEDVRFPFPPVALLSAFEEVVLPLWTQIGALKRQNRNLGRTRDLLLPRLLSGQIAIEAT